MTAYHLQARRAVPGSCPRREQTRLTDADSLDEALSAAGDLADQGFTVWVFRRSERPRLTATPGSLHLVTTVDPAMAGRRAAGDDVAMVRRR